MAREKQDNDQKIGFAAALGAAALLPDGGDEELQEIFDASALAQDMAHFVRIAGDVPGESLYRWTAGKGMHPLPADGFSRVSPNVRLFFDGFVAVAQALTALLDGKAEAAAPLYVKQNHVAVRDTVYDRYGARDERTYSGLAAGEPTSTAQINVRPASEPEAPSQEERKSAAPFIITAADLKDASVENDDGKSLALSALDELRARHRAEDPGSIDRIMAEQPPAAPEIEIERVEHVDRQIGGRRVVGDVSIGHVRGKGARK